MDQPILGLAKENDAQLLPLMRMLIYRLPWAIWDFNVVDSNSLFFVQGRLIHLIKNTNYMYDIIEDIPILFKNKI